jgi:NADH-quinone oxidoreductase subunit E
MALSQQLKDRVLHEFLPKYPTKRAVLTMALWLIQDEQGWISIDSCEELGELLDLDPMDVRGVASFYSMYNRRPVGKKLLEVCHTHACLVNGAHKTMGSLCERLGVDPHAVEHGEATTADGEYTIRYAECLAACDKAPAVQVNYRYYGPVTEQNAPDFLANMEKFNLEIPIDDPKAQPAAGPGYAMSGVKSR